MLEEPMNGYKCWLTGVAIMAFGVSLGVLLALLVNLVFIAVAAVSICVGLCMTCGTYTV